MLHILFIDGFIKVLTTFVFHYNAQIITRTQIVFKSLILTRNTTISIVHLYRYSIISFFIVSLT